jgi:hypothetical protein
MGDVCVCPFPLGESVRPHPEAAKRFVLLFHFFFYSLARSALGGTVLLEKSPFVAAFVPWGVSFSD